MDLFLETPRQQAERMLRQQQRLMEMQMQGAAVQPPAQNAASAVSSAGEVDQEPIPYSKIHMRRSLRSTSVVRVAVVGPSACVRWR